jgi:tetratricopeptide (TPR) repeat protein
MTMRYRILAVTALTVGVGLSTVACGRYSLSALKAQKAYKEANDLYRAQDWKGAASKYEYVLEQDPTRSEVYFFLGNSYDNAYKPARAGEAANDSYIQKAIENYRKAAEQDKNPEMKKLALQYLTAAYGPEKLNDPTQAEPIVQQLIAADPKAPENYFALSRIYEDSGQYDKAEAELKKARDVKPDDPGVYTTISGFYNRQGRFDETMEALHKAADLKPNDPQGHQLVAVYYFDKANKDPRLSDAQKRTYAEKGLTSVDRALGLNAEYSDALTYKNLLLRIMANTEKDRNKQQEYLREAERLRDKAIALNKKKTAGT